MNPAKEEFILLLKEAIAKSLTTITVEEDELAYSVSLSYGAEWDISSSIALRLARKAGAQPAALADAIAKQMRAGELVSGVRTVNGYINAVIDEKGLASSVIGQVIDRKVFYGASKVGAGRKVIIEFPSVNPNKPWHIGHLRNALLGDSISKIYSSCGYAVEKEDYIDDLGLQMAEILWGINNLDRKPDKKYDQFLGELYVEINKKLKEPGVEDSINATLKQMEDPASPELKSVRAIAQKSVLAQYQTAFEYGVYHDVLIWESDIVRVHLLERAMKMLAEGNITSRPANGKYAGCIVFNLKESDSEEEQEAKVLIRSNGVATYLAKDIAFHLWKLGLIDSAFRYSKFVEQPDHSLAYTSSIDGEERPFGGAAIAINVIGAAQAAPQAMLKSILTLVAGIKQDSLIHLSYGEVGLASGSLSGRGGGWMGEARNYTADDLLRELQSAALRIVTESKKAESGQDAEEIAKKVAIAAIKFEFLKIEPIKKVTFDWERALDFNANSGPYCMYMYARASRILERSEATAIAISDSDISHMGRAQDLTLIKKLSECPDMIEKACRELKPNVIADYALDLAISFGKFYEHMDVIKSGDAVNLRLAIVWATRQAIYNMLNLLGIETSERM